MRCVRVTSEDAVATQRPTTYTGTQRIRRDSGSRKRDAQFSSSSGHVVIVNTSHRKWAPGDCTCAWTGGGSSAVLAAWCCGYMCGAAGPTLVCIQINAMCFKFLCDAWRTVPRRYCSPSSTLRGRRCSPRSTLRGRRCSPRSTLRGRRCSPRSTMRGRRCSPRSTMRGRRCSPRSTMRGRRCSPRSTLRGRRCSPRSTLRGRRCRLVSLTCGDRRRWNQQKQGEFECSACSVSSLTPVALQLLLLRSGPRETDPSPGGGESGVGGGGFTHPAPGPTGEF